MSEKSKMNVYQKLQLARVLLQEQPMNKSGNNKFAGYTYFELGDFLPAINKIFNDLLLCSQISFTAELATLKVIDSETGDFMEFTSPMANASLKGCHDIQNMGAVQTYQRRYLYMTALEIVEHDVLDGMTGAEEKSKQENTKTLSDAQIKRLYAIAKSAGYEQEKVKEQVIKKYGCLPSELNRQQYDAVCEGYDKLPKKQ